MEQTFLIVMTFIILIAMSICFRKFFEFQSGYNKRKMRNKFQQKIHSPKPKKEISIWEEDLRIRTFIDDESIRLN